MYEVNIMWKLLLVHDSKQQISIYAGWTDGLQALWADSLYSFFIFGFTCILVVSFQFILWPSQNTFWETFTCLLTLVTRYLYSVLLTSTDLFPVRRIHHILKNYCIRSGSVPMHELFRF
jgi:hypothetical protein